MSNVITKRTFIEEVEPWDEGPHTIYEVYEGVSDHTTFYLKTKSGKWIKLFSAGIYMLEAIQDTNEEVSGDEFKEVMMKHREP